MTQEESPRPTRDEAEREKTGPGDISHDDSPHHSLNNPAGDPDPTEWPDPYDKREDPRDAEPGEHTANGATSTSEPHPRQDPIAQAEQEKLERDKLDD
ncbi:MAG TPA: hypothetical protein VD766_13610 [Solirubrobacterales bacterium]|nr:hypothetical protein [Solirubrobacterales bacterium]